MFIGCTYFKFLKVCLLKTILLKRLMFNFHEIGLVKGLLLAALFGLVFHRWMKYVCLHDLFQYQKILESALLRLCFLCLNDHLFQTLELGYENYLFEITKFSYLRNLQHLAYWFNLPVTLKELLVSWIISFLLVKY